MKNRTKITIIQISTLFCIVLSIGILYDSLTEIQSIKKLQEDFNTVVNYEYQLSDLLYNSLYTEKNIVEAGSEIILKYEQLTSLVDSLYYLILDDYMEHIFKDFYYQWYQKSANYYKPLNNNFKEFIDPESGWIQIIQDQGLLRAYDILIEQKANGFEDSAKLNKLFFSISRIENNYTDQYAIGNQIKYLQEELIYNIEVNIATNALILIIIIILTVTPAIIISMRISGSIIKKIKNVEESIQKISEGDLTTHITDTDNDEFQEIARSFNTLTDTLLKKSASMRDIMNEVGSIITESVDMNALLIKITELAKQTSNANSAVMLMVDKFSDNLLVEHVDGYFPPPYSMSSAVKSRRDAIEEKFKKTPIGFNSCYIAKESVLKGKPLFIKDSEVESDKLPINSNPRDILFIKSSMTFPLVVSNKLLGVISLAKTKREEMFSDLDFTNAMSFVEYVSLTIDNLYKYMELLDKSEMKREMGIASEIQTQLLPKKIPNVPNIDVSAFSNSARGISGDYYDIYKTSKDRCVATVCDVAGKGIPAALVLVIIRTILQLASNSRSTAKDLLTFLNKSISDRVKTDYFATLSILVYDDTTEEMTVSIAGETPILVYRSKEQIVERIYHNEVPVGIDKATVYKNKTIKLKEDDIVYMFTDGILEVRNNFNDVFSINELESFILENSNNRTETISLLLKNYLDEFRGSQDKIDDETVVIFKKI